MGDQFWQTLRPVRKVGKTRAIITVPVFDSIQTGPDNTTYFSQNSYWNNGAISSGLFGGTGITIEAWVKCPPGLLATHYFLVNNTHAIQINSNMTLRVSFRNTVPTVFIVDTILSLNRNEWNHVAAVCDGTNIYIYVNFKLDSITAFVGTLANNNGTILRLMDTFNNTCGMKANEFRFWNVARTLDQIKFAAFTTRDISGTMDVGLQGYWPMTEGTGTTIANKIAAHPITLTLTTYGGGNPAWDLNDSYPYNLGASFVAGQFAIDTSGKSFSIKFPVKKPYSTVNFVPCIRWLDNDGITVYRYKLWSVSQGFDVAPTVRMYHGQLIPDGAILEIWDLTGSNDRAVVLTEAFDIMTSILYVTTDANSTAKTSAATFTTINKAISASFPWIFPVVFNEEKTY